MQLLAPKGAELEPAKAAPNGLRGAALWPDFTPPLTPLMVVDKEDLEKSRRVVFSVSPNRQQLLDDIEGPLGGANRTVPSPNEARSLPANEHAFDFQRLSRL